MPPSDSAAGDSASMRSPTVSAATGRWSSRAISSIIDLTDPEMSFQDNKKRKNQAGEDGKGWKRWAGDPAEAQREEAHRKALNAVDAAQDALRAHGPQSQECQEALQLAEELVKSRGPHAAAGSASAMHCAAGSSGSTVGPAAGDSGSAVGPGLASEEDEEETPEKDDIVDLMQDEELHE